MPHPDEDSLTRPFRYVADASGMAYIDDPDIDSDEAYIVADESRDVCDLSNWA